MPQLIFVSPLEPANRHPNDHIGFGENWTPDIMDKLTSALDVAHMQNPQCGVVVVVRLTPELMAWTPGKRVDSQGKEFDRIHIARTTNLKVRWQFKVDA